MRLLSLPITLLLAMLCLLSPPLGAQQEFELPTANDIDFSVTRYAADGEYLLLWLAPEYGYHEGHRQLARRLPDQGIEVWQVDMLENLFLPRGAGSMRQLDGVHVADLIAEAHRASGKKIALAGDSYASLAVLAGAREWQRRSQDRDYLVGAVLFTPYTFASIPSLGLDPEYMPVVDATNIPLLIFQAQKSAVLYRFDELLERLRKNGSPIYTSMLPDVMSLFFKETPTAAMREGAARIAQDLRRMLPLLALHPVPADPVPMRSGTLTDSGIDIYLKEFAADIRPARLDLESIDGERIVKDDFTGQVTLINFWASWCAPCREEIPSLNRLRQKMAGRPFELISINYAEDRETVAEFMQRVPIDFTVLLDVDGEQAGNWRVISYPSTFVIGPRGRIRYGVNAAIDWNDPDLIDKLEMLMNEG
ncbi:MAG: TlpA disulfide reductase family protein [Gammaproteobacteria bacterium]|jgi:thiol-disulfide isomerase/thioredoxin